MQSPSYDHRRSSRPRSPPAKRRRTNALPPSPPPSLSRSPSRTPSPPTPPMRCWFRQPSVVWYRGNDLRVEDHPALLAAAQRGGPVIPFFVWDPLDGFGSDLGPAKSWWLRESLVQLRSDLARLGVKLYTRTGRSTDELRRFLLDTGADAVFWNRCYEPDLLRRDERLRLELAQEGFTAESFKAELLVEPWELTSSDVSPRYETFHAYMHAWMGVPPPPQPFPCPSRLKSISQHVESTDIADLGLECPPDLAARMQRVWKPGSAQAKIQLDRFLREVFPAFGEGRCRRHFDGTSRLSPHVRFGELSPRRMYHATRLKVKVSRWERLRAYANARSVTPPRRFNTSPPNPVVDELAAKSRTAAYARSKSRQSVESSNLDGALAKSAEEGSLNARISSRDENDIAAPVEKPDVGSRSYRPRERLSSEESNPNSSASALNSQQPQRKRLLPHISLSAKAFLKNLCLRDFSYHVLFHYPEFNAKPLIPEFNNFPWAEDNGSFESWKRGVTGYPIVDAAMRELKETGWVHNGMRFLLACFLTKYLLLPWSRGLKEFYKLLIDGDRSANALGWQWTAGSNTDAFPFGCLVNPVKVAYRHDPSGSYVRKWIPELSKLPADYIHQPWKAPLSLLKKAGINLGSTYPNRIIAVSEAKKRALSAMNVMRKVIAGSRVPRSFLSSNDVDVVKDWPEETPEVLQMDESNTLNGKMSLLPSLWALLQCDSPSNYLTTGTTGSDSLIALDTASLVEGALAVPVDDQHESIEHALITAHENPHGALGLHVGVLSQDERLIDTASFAPVVNSDGPPEVRANGHGNTGELVRLEEPLKYNESSSTPDHETEKLAATSREMPNGPVQGQNMHCSEVPSSQATRNTTEPIQPHGSSTGMMALSFQNQQPYLQMQMQQLQPFQQLQSLHMQHLQQQPPSQAPVRTQVTPTGQGQRMPEAKALPSRPEGHIGLGAHYQSPDQHVGAMHHSFLPHQQTQLLVHTGHSRSQAHHHQAHQRTTNPHNQEQTQNLSSCLHGGVDGVYNPANVGTPNNSVTGVPSNGTSLMMGQASSALDVPVGHVFGSSDPTTALYSHHMGMGPFYGFQPMVPIVNPPLMNGADRVDIHGTQTTINTQKMGMQGIMPFGYGMYGGNTVDPSALGNGFLHNGSAFASPGTTSHSQVHPNAGGPYRLPYRPMYVASPARVDPMQTPGGPSQMVRPSPPVANLEQAPTVESSMPLNSTNARTLHSSSGTGIGEFSVNRAAGVVQQNATGTPSKNTRVESLSLPRETQAPLQSTNRSPRRTEVPFPRVQGGRSVSKGTSKGRTGSRNKRSVSGQSHVGRNKAESGLAKGSGRSRSASSKAANQKSGVPSEASSTSLQARRDILTSVLEKKEHEYYGLAHYLSLTYELTGNTDRQTSKDYVRLCNLKDDYHKQCMVEKDKLKIYRIKSFFSKILKLEVTGEWDRHNHGGVRGPYVYGIRRKKGPETAVEASKGKR